ncbi:GntR family transcriptional regulator [Paraburkholderia domus]|uniref:GntR family transcriptional regulator n=1 Tax=Paraburkholderia domus TaxID=2793075 RepID=UPI00191459E4|nr:FCD domain-containing protein [Paraburkholderia domus]MBK5065990.1 FCD domain-containing protein [Burkholderia sp. R-70199]CAE6965094.1 HTH-type transcriptional repressor GlaR [Paraburkholderia domus]
MAQSVLRTRPQTEASRATLAEQAYEILQNDLLAGLFNPGEKLRPQALQERYGVGISPIREALMLLSCDGLVANEGQRGFRVAEMSREDLLDIIETRKKIETDLLTDSIRNGDEDWGAEITAAFYKLVHTPLPGPDDVEAGHRWELAHRRFHFALLDAARSSWLRRIDERLVRHSERYRRMRFADPVSHEVLTRDIATEHRELMDAVLGREEERACALLRAHIDETAQVVSQLFD